MTKRDIGQVDDAEFPLQKQPKDAFFIVPLPQLKIILSYSLINDMYSLLLVCQNGYDMVKRYLVENFNRFSIDRALQTGCYWYIQDVLDLTTFESVLFDFGFAVKYLIKQDPMVDPEFIDLLLHRSEFIDRKNGPAPAHEAAYHYAMVCGEDPLIYYYLEEGVRFETADIVKCVEKHDLFSFACERAFFAVKRTDEEQQRFEEVLREHASDRINKLALTYYYRYDFCRTHFEGELRQYRTLITCVKENNLLALRKLLDRCTFLPTANQQKMMVSVPASPQIYELLIERNYIEPNQSNFDKAIDEWNVTVLLSFINNPEYPQNLIDDPTRDYIGVAMRSMERLPVLRALLKRITKLPHNHLSQISSALQQSVAAPEIFKTLMSCPLYANEIRACQPLQNIFK